MGLALVKYKGPQTPLSGGHHIILSRFPDSCFDNFPCYALPCSEAISDGEYKFQRSPSVLLLVSKI